MFWNILCFVMLFYALMVHEVLYYGFTYIET